MKRKFIAIFSSLVVFFSSTISCYANPLVLPFIAPELLATLSTVLVGCGVQLTNNDDVYNVGRVFSDKNRDKWDNVIDTFKKDVSIGANGVVNVGSKFLDICKNTFDPYYADTVQGSASVKPIGNLHDLPYYKYNDLGYEHYHSLPSFNHVFNDITNGYVNYTTDILIAYDYSNLNLKLSAKINSLGLTGGKWIDRNQYKCDAIESIKLYFERDYKNSSIVTLKSLCKLINDKTGEIKISRNDLITDIPVNSLIGNVVLPKSSNYDWDKIKNNVDVDSGTVGLYVPGNVGSLPGVSSGDVISKPGVNSPPYELPVGGTVTVPGVSNPSIDIGDSITIPGDVAIDKPIDKPVDIPSEGLWTAISDFIVSLVVPNESYWVDTFNGFRNKLSSKFPGLDVSSLDGLCVNGLPLQDVKVSLMGTGSAVAFSGSTINSIASWLKPIVQGFIGVFLILYNYNQIYYLLRGTKPISLGRQGGSD